MTSPTPTRRNTFVPQQTTAQPAEPQTALVEREEINGALEARPPTKDKTASAIERRTVEVSEALVPAYQKAGTLDITDEEAEALMALFPDEAVEIRAHDGMIYLPHIHIRNRLSQVFKPGRWALVRRREWFDAANSDVYGEYVLLIRGCYVGEAIGGHQYNAKNAKTNYSDALEATAAEAIRRIAGKSLSCGAQVWDPEYARRWVAENAISFQKNGKQVWKKREASAEPRPTSARSAVARTTAGATMNSSEDEQRADPTFAAGAVMRSSSAGAPARSSEKETSITRATTEASAPVEPDRFVEAMREWGQHLVDEGCIEHVEEYLEALLAYGQARGWSDELADWPASRERKAFVSAFYSLYRGELLDMLKASATHAPPDMERVTPAIAKELTGLAQATKTAHADLMNEVGRPANTGMADLTMDNARKLAVWLRGKLPQQQ